MAKTVRELNRKPSLTLEDIPPDMEQIACTRSFVHPVSELNDLLEAISEFTSRAAEKLRHQHCQAGQLMDFSISQAGQAAQAYHTIFKPSPSNDSAHLTELACTTVTARCS